tara:strand:- start:731 stop:1105 length:375 start_codon:yes stop_codon:yes gene_type:complete
MSEGYKSNLEDGRAIFIPNWPATVQFENLTEACKYLGQENVINISTLNVPAAMVAVMRSDDAKATTQLVMHFIQQARMEGDKITINSLDSLGMPTIIELFTHVMHAQYNDFFESGLAKAASLVS